MFLARVQPTFHPTPPALQLPSRTLCAEVRSARYPSLPSTRSSSGGLGLLEVPCFWWPDQPPACATAARPHMNG